MVLALSCVVVGCTTEEERGTTLVLSASATGAEGEVLDRQLERFMQVNPGIRVERRATPDAADRRHQLYVQWLNAGAERPDVLQLDVVWAPELAAAGWIRPLQEARVEHRDFFEPALQAARWNDRLYALPWFVDVGMLYWRTDLLDRAPTTFAELEKQAQRAMREDEARYGLVWQGARYEGLATVFQEHLGGFGGRILGAGGQVRVDSPEGRRALRFMRRSVHVTGIVPREALTWQEEHTRFAFQNGDALFMRNWPYAYALMQDEAESKVADRFAVAPMPASPQGRSTAALGGQQLAINAHSRHPEAAYRLVDFLTQPEQMAERARVAGQLPARRSVYERDGLAASLPVPARDALRIIEHARPRPPTPVYTQLSRTLQIELHRALTRQRSVEQALHDAAARMRELLARVVPAHARSAPSGTGHGAWWVGGLLAIVLLLWLGRRARRAPGGGAERDEARVAWVMALPALAAIAAVALLPLAWAVWESLHLHDLRMPWLGRPFVGLEHYATLLHEPRFWGALGNTLFFTATSVFLEVILGLGLALLLDRAFRGRGLVRAATLLPWAVPTVVAALIWRFLFEGRSGLLSRILSVAGLRDEPLAWLSDPVLAWVPVILADVWKTLPFAALLLLAGLQGIDPGLYEAAKLDGAGPWRRFRHITWPLLRPALLVTLVFRTLDAFRVFDQVYVLTGGGPGTATEPLALYTYSLLLQSLRFGLGSAASVLVFGVSFSLALLYVWLLGQDLREAAR